MVGVLIEVPGGTQEMYDKAMKDLELTANGGDWPEGLISHIAGPNGDGWTVVDTWQSKAEFEKFVQERLGKAMQVAGMPRVEPKFFDIYLVHQT